MPRRLLLRGVAAFNAGRFFTAHEIWEAIWNETVGEEKRFVQGLVQLAAGYLKLSSAQYRGALKLLTRACQTLRTYPPLYAGLQISLLSEASLTVIRQLEQGRMGADIQPPQIQTVS
jgi:predicted metal-dependent hydrolase